MPKKIVVFADGTGNAFSMQASNIWRLYNALDQSQPDQIVHYIKGVGTSGFKPFALLDGATGIGVPSNVRKLYRFICWNWEPGAEIYMFGFSRGAFTIRTLIGLIHSEGLIPVQIEGEAVSRAEMRRNTTAAWRSYRSNTTSLGDTFITIPIARFVRNVFLFVFHLATRMFLGHRMYGTVAQATAAQRRKRIVIKFAGLFDTVEAFGVPIEELRRAIDWAIWPISFRDQILCTNVQNARHALALDDERETFHPVRFDLANTKWPRRIKEVWFAGMHSDVGGGYPEDDLSHVPLLWMIDELKGRLRFIPGAVQSMRSQESAYAPIHDSRSGLSVFYRYSPRTIGDNRGPPIIHHSVAEKIAFGAERYAPVTLPETALVLMPDGATRRIRGFVRNLAPAAAADARTALAQSAVDRLRDPSPLLVSVTRDAIWKRRVAYYGLLLAAFAVASLPWTARFMVHQFRDRIHDLAYAVSDNLGRQWDWIWGWLAGTDEGSSAFVASLFQYIGTALPGYAKPWSDAFIDKPWCCGIVTAIALYLYWKNGSLRDTIGDLARRAWVPTERIGQHQLSGRSFAHWMRTEQFPNWIARFTSRYVLPGVGLALIFLTIGISISRSVVTFREGSGALCAFEASAKPVRLEPNQTLSREGFPTDHLCWPSGLLVEKGRHYELTLDMVEPFFDQTLMTDVAGFKDASFRRLSAQFILRWWTADWFQPIAKVGRTGSDAWPLISADGDTALPIGTDRLGNRIPEHFYDDPSYKDRLSELREGPSESDPSRIPYSSKIPASELATANAIDLKYALRRKFVSRFTSPEDGELMLYVNDAIAAIPFVGTFDGFYRNNSGRATITLKRLSVAPTH
ncbi:DUF2235 domain-containing protein [Bradyrhizobium sp.]|uniref:DUF2235 domain-containing protein n=1 Tax=Bradyrhizobium sp. TaxID=376 RepID=UPI002630AAC4|nr:DUF2235 domain-containing protein [Bradyrhizobium sp.]